MIHIKDDYYITADENQFTLIRMTGRTAKDGKPVKEYLSYHATIAQALRAYLRRQERYLTSQKDMEIADALETFEADVQELQELVDKKTAV